MKRIVFNALAHAALAALLCAHAAGQAGVQPQPPPTPSHEPAVSAGTITDSAYVNEYFHLRLTIPEGWNVYDAQGRQMLIERGRKMLTSSDKSVQAGLDASSTRTVNLLTVTKLPQDQSGMTNAIFACGAERLVGSGIKTGEDYLAAVKKLLPYAKAAFQVEEDVASENINGEEFGVMTLKVEGAGVTVRQKYYAVAKRDYALFCISTYTNEADRQLMTKAMSSISFR